MPIVNFKAAMPNGMNRDWRARANIPFFELVKGLQATHSGLKSYYPVVQGQVGAYPYPDIFYGKRVKLAFYDNGVYDITTPHSPAAITLYDFSTYNHLTDSASVGSVTSGSQWHFMDNYATWMAFNGSCVVFKAAFSTKTFVTTQTTMLTGCNLIEGRGLLAGFSASDAIWDDLQELFEANESQLPDQLQGVYAGLDSTWAMWTSIGGPELLGLLDVNFLKYNWFDNTQNTGYDDTHPLLLDLLRSGEFGARPLLQPTGVLKAMSMGAFAIVYQEAGVNALWPSAEPLPTYAIVNPATGTIGIRNLPRFLGPLNRGCVGGNDDVHLMLTSENDLFLIEREGFAAKYIQASHVLGDLSPSTVRISMDEVHKDFYICGLDGSSDLQSYCFSHSEGLTKCPKATASLSMFGGPIGPWEASEDASAINVVSMPFDAAHPQIGGVAGTMGSLHSVRINAIRGDSTDGWKCVVYYRLRIQDAWTATTAVSFDDRGVASFDPVPGIEWKISVTHDDCTKTLGLDELMAQVEFGAKIGGRQWINASDPGTMAVPTP